MSPESYIFLGLLAGAFIVGGVVFCVLMLRSITTLNSSVNTMVATLSPLLTGQTLITASQAIAVAAETLPHIRQQLAGLNSVMNVFNSAVLNKGKDPTPGADIRVFGDDAPPDDSSSFIPFSESETAQRYREHMSREQRYPMGTSSPMTPTPEPSPEQIVQG